MYTIKSHRVNLTELTTIDTVANGSLTPPTAILGFHSVEQGKCTPEGNLTIETQINLLLILSLSSTESFIEAVV